MALVRIEPGTFTMGQDGPPLEDYMGQKRLGEMYKDINWKDRKGLVFKSSSGDYTGYGLFAAVSYDEGKTWPDRRLITPGGLERKWISKERTPFLISDTLAEPVGYLTATQSRDGNIQLLSSRNHYVFNLAWLKQLPPAPN